MNDSIKPAADQVIGPFVLNNSHEYPAEVIVSVPSSEVPDAFDKYKFVVVFKHIDPEERSARMRDYGQNYIKAIKLIDDENNGRVLTAEEAATARNTPALDLAMLRDVLVRIQSGVIDADKRDISQEPGVRDALLRNQWARASIWAKYCETLHARDSLGN